MKRLLIIASEIKLYRDFNFFIKSKNKNEFYKIMKNLKNKIKKNKKGIFIINGFSIQSLQCYKKI